MCSNNRGLIALRADAAPRKEGTAMRGGSSGAPQSDPGTVSQGVDPSLAPPPFREGNIEYRIAAHTHSNLALTFV